MPHFDPLATVQGPLTACGLNVVNRHGETIATVTNSNPWLASAIAELCNLGAPAQEAKNAAHEARENRVMAMFLKSAKR
jgi:hypothetical protein